MSLSSIPLLSSLFIYTSLSFCIHAQSPVLKEATSENFITNKRSIYKENLSQLDKYRKNQAATYKNANNTEKKIILKQVKARLEAELCTNVFPAWYGTPWDFNGISKTPGEGKIACGYFVSTCLVHIGYNVPRIKLAQQPSQRIIKTFVQRSGMDISSQRSMDKIRTQLKQSGNGIYIVGLDTHVGFVTVEDDTMTFVHSSYYRPARAVTAELIDTKNPLSDSKYRVFGKLFSDKMLINWLQNHRYTVAR